MTVAVSILLLQSVSAGNPGQLAASRGTADRWNNGERRQVQGAFDFFGRVDRVVEVLEEECETETQTDRQEEGSDDCAGAIWTNRTVRREGIVDYRDIVRLAR